MRHITVVLVADLLSFQVLDQEISSWQCMRSVSFESLLPRATTDEFRLRYVGKGDAQRASVEGSQSHLQKKSSNLTEEKVQKITDVLNGVKEAGDISNLTQNSQAVKKVCGPQKAMVKKDVKSKVAAKKWL